MKAPAPGPALLLVNPTSGRGRGRRLWEQTAAALHAAGYTPTVHLTENLTEATQRARTAAPGSLIAALGGDGFLGATAAGAKESGAVLLPLAGGRGNDTIRRIALNLDPVRTVRDLSELVVRDMELGLVNGRPYLGVANVGFDALANDYGNSARINLGPFVYLYGGLRAFAEWRNVTFTLEVDGVRSSVPGWFVAVGNVGQYGGGLRICPQARIDDGLLDIVALGRAGIVGVAMTFLRSYRGNHVRQENVSFTRGRVITLNASKPLDIFADGENVGRLPATITILPAALQVLVPKNSPVFC
ncbi:diacylglycerol kinase family protein [Paeniglutamicibacter sp. Y32M11]|uniref:diacylglycerol/lipid kinase family protein n=1 Tax=Paeniglutamicibacter sp. Y32M11 TaxID=2853258 RepID=UPI001C52CD40|nr:diacylglycerol kinase family protein [Paeniglutamicibacter sp. Y32M11]QXQ08907.1 diacylglycerol kinase family lipid kinase [Paeniglutamicibacter sp. Y32M11]